MERKRVLVIGGGVIGSTTALELLQRGYDVTIVAKQYAKRDHSKLLTSEVAGALWEYPPWFCGRHAEVPLERPKKWAMASYERYYDHSKRSKETGVYWRDSVFYFPQKVEEMPEEIDKWHDVTRLPGFRHSASIIKETGVSPTEYFPVVDAYTHEAPTIDTELYMQFLYKELSKSSKPQEERKVFYLVAGKCDITGTEEDKSILEEADKIIETLNMIRAKGGRLVTGEIKGLLKDQIDELKSTYGVDVVVNCTGMAAKELAGDDQVYPIRGVVLHVKNDGVLMPKLNYAITVAIVEWMNADNEDDASNWLVYLIPRGEDRLWIGGIVEPDKYDLNVTLDYRPLRLMWEKAKAFYPPLRALKDEDVQEVVVGLRPGRHGDIRLEADPSCPSLVHCYGHAGAGWILAWGSAIEAANLVERELIIRNIAPARL